MSLTASIIWFVVALIIFAITVIIPIVRYIKRRKSGEDETL